MTENLRKKTVQSLFYKLKILFKLCAKIVTKKKYFKVINVSLIHFF